MSVQVRRRREAAAFLSTFVGAQGELLVDTTNNRVQVHDGATPGGFAAAKLSEVITNTRTTVADSNYTALPTDRLIAYTALSAARVLTLPAASSYPTGTQLVVVDEAGTCSASNTITLGRVGTDLVNGATSVTVASAYGFVALVSNGTARWTVVDQSAGSVSAAAITGGTIDNTPIGATTRSSGAFTSLAVSSTLVLPSNSIPNAALAQMGSLTVKANVGSASATPVDATLSVVLDASQGSTRGAILFRGAGGWSALAPGVSGTVLTANGSGDDPTYQAVGAAAALAVPVRQTVMGGPTASGVPSFLPSSSAGLTLTATGVSPTTALTLTAAQGFGSTGAVNFVYQFTSNPSWTATASTTNYLYINASSGATGTTTLAPNYQFGGTIAVTNGQFTFDTQAMIGYLGNGTTAVATPLVFVGECVAGASTITSTAAYAYNGYYESTWTGTAPAATANVSYTTNLGLAEVTPQFIGEWTTATSGYAVGERNIFFAYDSALNINAPLTLSVSRLAASFTSSNNNPFYYYPKTSYARAAVLAAATTMRFKLVVKRNF
jgi:hypothetical protein